MPPRIYTIDDLRDRKDSIVGKNDDHEAGQRSPPHRIRMRNVVLMSIFFAALLFFSELLHIYSHKI